MPEELRARHRSALANHHEHSATTMIGRRLEVPALRKDGTRITVELAITRIRSEDGLVFSAFLRDISAQRRAARELIEARAAMDGYTLARTLRERGSRLAIVALTAHAMEEDRERCLETGCDDYAVKPIQRISLLETCARWLDGARSGGSSRAA